MLGQKKTVFEWKYVLQYRQIIALVNHAKLCLMQ